jgi:hypothetical protein
MLAGDTVIFADTKEGMQNATKMHTEIVYNVSLLTCFIIFLLPLTNNSILLK